MLTTHKKWLSDFEVTIYVNEGLKLLEGHTDKTSRIVTYDCCNPIPVALQLPVARGSMVGWIPCQYLDESHHPPPEVAFENATCVMVPKMPIIASACEFGERVCGPYVREHFEKTAESPYWTLYLRKSADKITDAKDHSGLLPYGQE